MAALAFGTAQYLEKVAEHSDSAGRTGLTKDRLDP
jgi:hypothetical protein